MEIARHWRLKQQRYGLIGEVCPNCDYKIFPPRDVCPNCANLPKNRPVGENGQLYTKQVETKIPATK